MKKRKLNIKRVLFVIIIPILIIFFSIKFIIHKNSIDYKLKNIGYSKNEIYIITNNLEKDEINSLLSKEYSYILTDIIEEKYFIFEYLDDYIGYYKNKLKLSSGEIVSLINTKAYLDPYDNIKNANLLNDILILVNKYNKLEIDYEPDDLVSINLLHAYDNNKLRKVANDNYIKMCTEALKEGYHFITDSSYRSYSLQENIYNNSAYKNGKIYADKYVARPGHSEHETGLALDIKPYNKIIIDIEQSEEHIWLINNSYKYGFILRYPKDKEKITGFAYEPWHFRYVGLEVANYIYKNNITFDEYYAYYLEKN